MGDSEGQLPNQTSKEERNQSMVVKAERRKTARKLVCQDLHPMVKATLPELQSPVEAHQLDGKQRLIPVSARVESDWGILPRAESAPFAQPNPPNGGYICSGSKPRRQTENLRGAQRER